MSDTMDSFNACRQSALTAYCPSQISRARYVTRGHCSKRGLTTTMIQEAGVKGSLFAMRTIPSEGGLLRTVSMEYKQIVGLVVLVGLELRWAAGVWRLSRKRSGERRRLGT